MAQSFVSTYRNHYRWHDIKRITLVRPVDRFDNFCPPEDIWFKSEVDDEELSGDEADRRIHKLHMKRMQTTYQRHYCKDQISKSAGDLEGESFENELFEYCKNLYEPESRPKVQPPLPRTRKVFGYVRPARLYTPLTNYQHWIGKTAFNILKGEVKAQQPPPIEKTSTDCRCSCICE